MTTIRDKKILITGAAHGMGKLMAFAFARRGGQMILVDVDEAGLADVEAGLEATGKVALSVVCDLSKREEIAKLREEVTETVGRIDILVNNAGVVTAGPLEEISDERDQLMMDVNMGAVHWMTKAFMPDLKAGDDTHLIQLASAAGLVGVPGQVVYCASKWFVVGFSEAIRLELKEGGYDHVGISVICPSFVDTGMFDGARPPLLSPMLQPDFVVERIMEAVESEEFYVQEPFIVRLMPLMRATLPTRVLDTLMDATGATRAMTGWKGHK